MFAVVYIQEVGKSICKTEATCFVPFAFCLLIFSGRYVGGWDRKGCLTFNLIMPTLFPCLFMGVNIHCLDKLCMSLRIHTRNVIFCFNISTFLRHLRIFVPNDFQSYHSLLAHNLNAYSAFIKVSRGVLNKKILLDGWKAQHAVAHERNFSSLQHKWFSVSFVCRNFSVLWKTLHMAGL